jgi:hypothetical protein
MNPWGLVLVAVGVVMIMIGITGTQHNILTIVKGIPQSAGGAPASSKAAQSNTGGSTGINPATGQGTI